MKSSTPFWSPYNGDIWKWFCYVIICAGMEKYMRKVVITNMLNYRWFLLELISLATFLVTLIFCIYNRHKVTPEMRCSISRYKYFIMGSLDALHAMCLIMPIGIVPGHFSVLIPEFILPLQVMFSITCGSNTFRFMSFCGSVLVISGIISSVVSDYDMTFQVTSITRASLLSNILILFCSAVPGVLSSMYKQSVLLRHEVNMHYMNIFTSLSQFLCVAALCPVALKMQDVNMSQLVYPSMIPQDIRGGFLCLVGINTFSTDNCHSKLSLVPGVHLLLYAVFFIGSEYLQLKLTSKMMAARADIEKCRKLEVKRKKQKMLERKSLAKDQPQFLQTRAFQVQYENNSIRERNPLIRRVSYIDESSQKLSEANTHMCDPLSLPQGALVFSVSFAFFLFYIPPIQALSHDKHLQLSLASGISIIIVAIGSLLAIWRPIRPLKHVDEIWEYLETPLDESELTSSQ